MANVELPGWQLPLDYHYKNTTGFFPHVLEHEDIGDAGRLCTYREIFIMRVVNAITDKRHWERKIFHETITAKWREKIAASGKDITPSMIDWIMDEVKWKVENYSAITHIVVFDSGVVKSDTAISEKLQNALRDGVRELEDSTLERTTIQALMTKLWTCIGQGSILPVPGQEAYSHAWTGHKQYSCRFQWLPCDVDLLGDGSCAIVSYINNLHPQQNVRLYHVIEEIIAEAIPLWNTTLTCMKGDYWRIQYHSVEYEEAIDDDFSKYKPPGAVKVPEPGKFFPPQFRSSDRVNLYEFGNTGLQIIVKLANIELTPEKPEYQGGSWHVEGQLNEHICATAIYYYDSENITSSSLSFRQRASTYCMSDLYPEQDRHDFLQKVYGFPEETLGNGSTNVTQELGSVVTKEGRLLTFANILQHRVSPFSLADRSKPGHRKILALFLVDPHLRIISSSNVPPQREDWAVERERSIRLALQSLPQELKDAVCDNLDAPCMTMGEAEEIRLELMKERSSVAAEQNRNFETGDFFLYEH
ncbi:hypothetical protein BDV26DRAFT_298060 [Aspergillus bertholletiae]|uniref:Uncharacterized protein n=1 Tax=Aspergillus bertholletiae TaxID=1226010 RepID=A0A5N7AQR1_9EURO|nr:hypothetical protein BDV26DRAFT_298060 [Aspergillus bertholletiae]